MHHEGDRAARHDRGAEAVVVLDAQAAGDEHAGPERLVLHRQADVVPRRTGGRAGHPVVQVGRARRPSRRRTSSGASPRMPVVGQPPVALVAGVVAAQVVPLVVGEVEELERRGVALERRRVGRIEKEVRRRLVRHRQGVGRALVNDDDSVCTNETPPTPLWRVKEASLSGRPNAVCPGVPTSPSSARPVNRSVACAGRLDARRARQRRVVELVVRDVVVGRVLRGADGVVEGARLGRPRRRRRGAVPKVPPSTATAPRRLPCAALAVNICITPDIASDPNSADCAPRTSSTRSRFSVVTLPKSNVPPGSLSGMPSSRTFV